MGPQRLAVLHELLFAISRQLERDEGIAPEDLDGWARAACDELRGYRASATSEGVSLNHEQRDAAQRWIEAHVHWIVEALANGETEFPVAAETGGKVPSLEGVIELARLESVEPGFRAPRGDLNDGLAGRGGPEEAERWRA